MHFGVLSTVDAYPEIDLARSIDRPREAMRLVPLAERLGFESFWITEHHFQWGGTVPSPPVWIAAAAQGTVGMIRLGVLVAVLPLHDPRELAEQYALADRLTGGRLEIGVGSGYVAAEFEGFGKPIERRRRSLSDNLSEFLRAMQGAPLMCPGTPVRLNVRPIQRPHPPVWRAAGRPESIEQVARSGDRLALIPYATLAAARDLQDQVSRYRAAFAPPGPARALAAVHVYVGTEPRRAERALQRFLDTRPLIGHAPIPDRSRPPRPSARELRERRLALIGSEREVRDGLEEYFRSGVTDLVGIFDFGGLPEREVASSLRRWAGLVGVPSRPRAA